MIVLPINITVLEINAVLSIMFIGDIIQLTPMEMHIPMGMETKASVTMHKDAKITVLIACLDGQ